MKLNDYKIYILFIAKYLGFFWVSKKISDNRLKILCYHGFSYNDQDSFRPKLYINRESFASRIDHLKKNGFQFIQHHEIDDVLNGRTRYELPVLLTFDDGWKSTHEIALPILKNNNIPHIIYLYTDCFQRKIPVINVLLQYALWKTPLDRVDFDETTYQLTLPDDTADLLNKLLLMTNDLEGDDLDRELASIFKLLSVDYSKSEEWENFRLLNVDELKDHLANGGSIQLHTHHHINPLQDDALRDEVLENKRVVESVTGQPAEHFCYPSGVYSREQFPLLEELGIKSAVTCEPGLNDQKTHPYMLKRFLDGENISQIEFEAEMCGFLDLCRRFFKR